MATVQDIVETIIFHFFDCMIRCTTLVYSETGSNLNYPYSEIGTTSLIHQYTFGGLGRPQANGRGLQSVCGPSTDSALANH